MDVREPLLPSLCGAPSCCHSLDAPASADSGDFPRATKTDGKRNYVWVGEGIYQKVTGYHAVPGWLVGRIIYYWHEGAFASGYSPC